jgi:hypothetical protein
MGWDMTPTIRGARRWVAIGTAALFLAGCAGPSYYRSASYQSSGAPGLTSDERLLREQSDSFVQDNVFGGAVTGAVVGCVAGALLGALIAHNAKGAAIGCGAGGAGGAIVGGVDGYMQGKAAQAQANQVVMARSVAEDVRRQNQELENAIQTAQRVVDQDQRKIDALNARLASKQVTLAQARAEAEAVRDNSRTIQTILADAQKKRDNFVQARNRLGGADGGELDAEIAALNNQIAQLEQQVSSINASLRLSGLG